jgi:hypothetical protein
MVMARLGEAFMDMVERYCAVGVMTGLMVSVVSSAALFAF